MAKQPDHCRCRDWVPPRRSEREGFATSNVPNLRGQVTLNGLEVRICLERNGRDARHAGLHRSGGARLLRGRLSLLHLRWADGLTTFIS